MTDTMPLIFFIPTIILILISVGAANIAYISLEFFFKRLKREDPNAFTRLGNPSFFSFNPLNQFKAFAIIRKIAANHFDYLNDDRYCADLHRVKLSFIIFISTIVIILIFGFTLSSIY